MKFAEQAAADTRGDDPVVLDTLAAAYAEAGQFNEAIETINKAIKLTKPGSQFLHEFEERLKLYQAHKPYHDPLPPGVVDPSEAKPKSSAAPAAVK